MDRKRALPTILAAAACVVCLLPYLPAVRGFFASDDWVWLYHYGRVPLSRVSTFFSPYVIWFYRPLQSLQFAALYHLFGVNPLPYNLALLTMHLAVCALLFVFVRDLSKRPWFSAGAAAIFASQWIYADILLWKSNYSSLQWAALTLGACIALNRYLSTRRLAWLFGCYVLCAANFFAKEMAVNTPLLLLLIWAYRELERDDLQVGRWRRAVRRAALLLWPAFGMAVAYVILHKLLVHDICPGQRPGYSTVGPLQALRQSLFIYNHALLSAYADPLLLPRAPWLQSAVRLAVNYALILPFALLLLGWRKRDRLLLFGAFWILLSFVPAVFLKDFHSSRFYYLPAVGAAIVIARLIETAWRTLVGKAGVRFSLARVALGLAVAYWATANIATTAFMVRQDRQSSSQARAAFVRLTAEKGRIPRGALVVLRNPPPGAFNGGFGAAEMVKLALDDPTAEGVVEGQPVEPARLARLRRMPTVYVLDLSNGHPRLACVGR